MFEQMKEIIRNYVQVADEDIHEDSRGSGVQFL